MAKKMSDAQRRRFDNAVKKSQELVDKGVAFNPKGVSPQTREHAASNQKRASAKGTDAAARIRAGESGSATAKKGARASFKGKRKR